VELGPPPSMVAATNVLAARQKAALFENFKTGR